MECSRHQFLARAAFPGNQDGSIGLGNASDYLEYLLQSSGNADHLHWPFSVRNCGDIVCGVPALYTVLCGPRGDAALPPESALATLGYTKEMVFKF